MSSSSTSPPGERVERLAARFRTVVGADPDAQLRDIAEQFVRWIESGADPAGVPRAPVRRLAKLSGGDLDRLADIQEVLAAVVEPSDASGAPQRISPLLVRLTRAFAQQFSGNAGPPDGRASAGETPCDSEADKPAWNQEFLQQIIDTLGDPLFVKDEQHCWVLLNDAYCQFMGYPREQLLGKSDYDFFPEEEADVFREKDDLVFTTGEPDENEERFTDADGNEHVIITKKTCFTDSRDRKFLVGIIRDITDRKRLEARLDVARRLMSLGTLAGGIAHEINNPLSYVLTNLDYLAQTLGESHNGTEERRDALEAAVRGAHRVQEVVDSLSTFSDVSENDLEPVDIQKVLESTAGVAAGEIRQHARLIESYEPLPAVDASEQALHQVFFNLLANATEAIEASDQQHAEIRVQTRRSDAGEAVVEISDNGPGIPPDVQNHIFDPFFTTKEVGEGTGLGLAICHSLVGAMNGYIEVDSTPGQGTTFRVVFPPAGQPTWETEADRSE